MKVVEQKVTLVDYMGSDLSVVNAARVSFDKESEWYILADDGERYPASALTGDGYYGEDVLSEKDERLIKYLAKHNHWSPFSHAVASFRVKAPIFVARQLAKHQVGFSWNEVSRRYVDSEPEFYIPPLWRKRAENVKQGSSTEAVPFSQDPGKTLTAAALETYKYMLNLGVCPEQARMVLPQNTMTEWIWTGSLYGWARMCKLRLDEHTQLETRYVAKRISDEMRELFPVSWQVLMEN